MIRRRHIVLLLAAALTAAGCVDEQGRITEQSVRAFWEKVDRDLHAPLNGGDARPAVAFWPAVGRPRPQGPPRGTLLARRSGRRIDVDVYLTNVPTGVDTVASGLVLADGEALPPTSVYLRRTDPPTGPSAEPAVDFAFQKDGPRGAGGGATVCLSLTYRLEPAASADGSRFTVVLGEPDGSMACELGIASAVALRDGGPSITGCVRVPAENGCDGPPLPPIPLNRSPTVTFRLRERPGPAGGGTPLCLVPSVEAVWPTGPPVRTAATARGPAPQEE